VSLNSSTPFNLEAGADPSPLDLLQVLAAHADAGIVLTDLVAQENLYVNGTYISHFGLDPDGPPPTLAEAFGMVRPEDAEFTASKIASGTLEPFTGECLITGRDGIQRWIYATYVPVAGQDGSARYLATIGIDITARKNAEAALAAAKAEAERANAAKDEFLSRMSHELRTPLNAVLGFAQLLHIEDLPTEQREAVDFILRGGRHLRGMINDLLDIASIESERLELSAEPVGVADIINDTVGLLQPLASANDVTIFIRTSASKHYVRADVRRIKQVLINLISNAIKYNRPGGRVDVAAIPLGEMLQLNVSDTGIGIPAEDLPRLFSPFERLGQQASDIEGSGIGLALSQRLATAMGGRLDVDSVPGEGSTFTLSLPAAVAPQAVALVEDVNRTVASEALKPGTLLYIEDNKPNVELLRGILRQRAEWSMTHAATGEDGLEFAALLQPDVVLLDLHLPDIDGIEVLRTLKASPETAHIPVIILSADANARQVSRGLAVGAEKYFIKPININDIFGVLDPHTRQVVSS